MRRRISLLLTTVLAGGMLTFLAPAQPAGAVTVCGGQGTAAVTPGLKIPIAVNLPTSPLLPTGLPTQLEILIGKPNVTHSFTFGFTTGGCVHPPAHNNLLAVTASGILKGYCGHSSGTGTIAGTTTLFSYISAGTFLVLTGHLIGLVSAISNPDSTTGSCLHLHAGPQPPVPTSWSLATGATSFLITGGAIGLNCEPGLTTLGTGGVGPEDIALLQRILDTSILSPDGSAHLWVNLGLHLYYNRPCVGTTGL